MNKVNEPDSRFVERLEWQLASEFRRANRLKLSPPKVAVSRRMIAVTCVVGALLAGVAVIKAADYIKDSWRKKIEVARAETEVKLKRAQLEFAREMAAQTETRFSNGLIQQEEYQLMQLSAEMAALELEKSLSLLDEVNSSGEAPRNELYAPVLSGRDFVSERLKLEIKELELDQEALTRRGVWFGQLVGQSMIAADQLDALRAEIAARKGQIEKTQVRLGLRTRFLAGEVTAQEVEILDRVAAAEGKLEEAWAKVDSLKERMERLQALETKGLISKTLVQQLRYALDSAQAELSLAALEKDILEKVKQR